MRNAGSTGVDAGSILVSERGHDGIPRLREREVSGLGGHEDSLLVVYYQTRQAIAHDGGRLRGFNQEPVFSLLDQVSGAAFAYGDHR